jgi:hypothetical protein
MTFREATKRRRKRGNLPLRRTHHHLSVIENGAGREVECKYWEILIWTFFIAKVFPSHVCV